MTLKATKEAMKKLFEFEKIDNESRESSCNGLHLNKATICCISHASQQLMTCFYDCHLFEIERMNSVAAKAHQKRLTKVINKLLSSWIFIAKTENVNTDLNTLPERLKC